MSGPLTAQLGYLDDPCKKDDDLGLHYFADFSRSTNARLKPVQVIIEDARGHAGRLTLEREGFTLVRWPTSIRDFIDTQSISDAYIAECGALIRHLSGCDLTLQAGPIHCRFDGIVDPKGRYDGRPAHYVHTDYSPASFNMCIAALPAQFANCPRYAIYNIWRVLSPPPQSQPLAVCDATSLQPGDEQESKVILAYPDGEDVEFFTQLYRPSARHRWYYFSDMTADEVLVFKSCDSDPDESCFVPHCAFRDGSLSGEAVRMSIEARILAIFTS
jgi:hypothetical protein